MENGRGRAEKLCLAFKIRIYIINIALTTAFTHLYILTTITGPNTYGYKYTKILHS